MTKEVLLEYQLTHNKGGNGWACVQFDPEGDPRFIRIMSATIPHTERRAILAALSALSVSELMGAAVPLGEAQLANLQPFRDGLADGSLKVVFQHVLPAGKATTAALV